MMLLEYGGKKMINKVCFAASSGGHLEEIAKLQEIGSNYDSFLVTEKGDFGEVKFCDKVFYESQINRKEKLFIFKFIKLTFDSLKILISQKPDCIISTGALATVPICVLGKMFKRKVIYIESFARVDSPSLTGKIMYKVADLFIVQWKDMLKHYPKAVYGGKIF